MKWKLLKTENVKLNEIFFLTWHVKWHNSSCQSHMYRLWWKTWLEFINQFLWGNMTDFIYYKQISTCMFGNTKHDISIHRFSTSLNILVIPQNKLFITVHPCMIIHIRTRPLVFLLTDTQKSNKFPLKIQLKKRHSTHSSWYISGFNDEFANFLYNLQKYHN